MIKAISRLSQTPCFSPSFRATVKVEKTEIDEQNRNSIGKKAVNDGNGKRVARWYLLAREQVDFGRNPAQSSHGHEIVKVQERREILKQEEKDKG